MPPRNSRSVAARARSDEPVGGPDAQDGLWDREVTDDVLAQALERRERARQAKLKAQRDYKEAHDVVKGKIDAMDLEVDDVVRVGRFRFHFRKVSGSSVSFATAERRQLDIRTLE